MKTISDCPRGAGQRRTVPRSGVPNEFARRAASRRVPAVLLVLLLAAGASSTVAAQEAGRGSLRGEVVSGGAPIGSAGIRILGSAQGATTDPQGIFHLQGLSPGEHTLEVLHVGFEPRRVTVAVQADRVSAARIELQPRVHAMEEVVVTAQFEPTEARNSVYRVRVMGRQAMDQRGAADLGSLLLQEMNARVLQDNVLGRTVVLQGMSGQNVKILLDGVPLISGEANQFDLGQLNLNQVERVEIIEGPLSVQYGTNALAGTINLITRRPAEGGFRLGANTYLESVGQYNVDGSVGGTVGRARLQLTGGRNRFEGFSSLDADRTKNWNPKTQYVGGLRAVYPLRGLNLTLAQNLFWEEAVGLGVPTRTPSFAIANDRYYTSLRNQTDLFLNGWIDGRRYLDLVAGRQRYGRDSERYLVNLADNTRRRTDDPRDHAHTSFTTAVLRGTYSHSGFLADRLAFQLGYDLNLHDSEGERVSRDRSSATDAGVFLSLSAKPLAGLEVQPGVRWLHNNLYDPREVDFLGLGLPVVPSVSLWHSLGERTQWRASYARGFRAPSLRELYYFFHDANHSIDGNPELLPETAHNLTLSARHTLSIAGARLTLEPSAFDNRMRNQIYLANKVALRPEDENKVAKIYVNVPSFRTRGANLGAALETDRLSVRPGVGILARSGTRSTERSFVSYEATTTLAYRPGADLSLGLFHKYNGPISEFSLLEGRLVDRTLHRYQLLDLSVSRPFRRQALTVTAGVKNLLDVTDVAQTGEGQDGILLRASSRQSIPVAWGRTAFLKVDWTK